MRECLAQDKRFTLTSLHGVAVNIQAFGNSRAMAVAMEMWQNCMVEMQKMNAENLAKVVKQQNDALTELSAALAVPPRLRTHEALAFPSCSKETRASTRSGRRS